MKKHMDSGEEKWKEWPIDPFYLVSNKGNIKRAVDGKIKKIKIHPGEYTRVMMREPNKATLMHRVVAETWIPNPHKKRWVNHINGLKHDNRAENLEWCTGSENAIHAFRLGLREAKRGGQHYRSTVSEEQVLRILELVKTKLTRTQISILTGVSDRIVADLINGRSWHHLTGSESQRDRIAMHGSNHISAKLTESDVIEIRNCIGKHGATYTSLGRQYSVSYITIRNLVIGKTWKHVK